MKADVFNIEGKKIKEIDLPTYFNLPYREDLISKVYEALKFNAMKPYGSYILAGKETSASGKVRHRRRKYRGHYGRGISRVPRKILSRRKPQGFYWVGAFIASARGGRRAHPPKSNKRKRKINKKEKFLALLYALTAIANKEMVINRYARLKEKKQEVKFNFPFIIDGLNKLKKVKEIRQALVKILAPISDVVFKQKKVRAGKGKLRGRRYKKSAGLLLVIGKDDGIKAYKTLGIDVVQAEKLAIKDLAPGNQPARLTAFTINGLKELDAKIKQQAEKLKINLEMLQK